MKRILVIGANGFLGMKLISSFSSNEAIVDALIYSGDVRHIDYVRGKCHRVFCWDFETGDPIDEDETYDSIINFSWAGANGPAKANADVQQGNIKRSLLLAAMAIKHKAIKFIGIGTISEKAYLANRDLSSASLTYGKYKHECYLRLSEVFNDTSVHFLWIQLANLFGEEDFTGNLISYCVGALSNGEPAILGPCNDYYDFLYVGDAIEAIRRFAISDVVQEGQVYLGSSNPQKLREYLLDLGSVLDCPHLLKFGARPDDGMKFELSFFDNSNAVRAIGAYETGSFHDHMMRLYGETNT